jgi:hypothetical protein
VNICSLGEILPVSMTIGSNLLRFASVLTGQDCRGGRTHSTSIMKDSGHYSQAADLSQVCPEVLNRGYADFGEHNLPGTWGKCPARSNTDELPDFLDDLE